MNDFERLYMCDFTPSEKDLKLSNLAKCYHDICERYDLTVCSGRSERDDCAVPIGGYQLRMVNLNARHVFKSLCDQNPDVSPRELRRTISKECP